MRRKIRMTQRKGAVTQEKLIAILVVLAIVIAVAMIMLNDPAARKGNQLSAEFGYDLSELKKVDPALCHYEEAAILHPGMATVTCIAAGPDGSFFVAGGQTLKMFGGDGRARAAFQAAGKITCMTHGHGDLFYLGLRDHVAVYDAAGNAKDRWPVIEGTPHLTAITLGENLVFAADAGNQQVLCYDRQGKLVRELGQKDPARNIPGIHTPSFYLEAAAGRDGLIRVTNPGHFQVELYTPEGALELSWGKASNARIEGFCGCCNPSHIALLPNGDTVTSEKGLYRIKVYDAKGVFQSVVATPDQLGRQVVPLDVAVDSGGRILALDAAQKKVRIFTRKKGPEK